MKVMPCLVGECCFLRLVKSSLMTTNFILPTIVMPLLANAVRAPPGTLG